MKLLIVGISFKTSPEYLREKASMIKRQVLETLLKLKDEPQINEAVLISTCNRNEIFVITENIDEAENILKHVYRDLDPRLADHLYSFSETQALKHLIEVGLGLDSMVLFEDQILGQLKTAMELADMAGTQDKFLGKYFREAVTISKDLRNRYKISEKPTSLSATAVKYVKSVYPDFNTKRVLIIGSGEMGQRTLRHLISEGFDDITLTNRTYHPGDTYSMVAPDLKIIEYRDRYKHLNEFDVIISATASAHTILRRAFIPKLDHNLLIIDLALPKDIDRQIGLMDEVDLITIDDFQRIIETGQKEKLDLLPLINVEIQLKIAEIEAWKEQTYYDPFLEKINDLKQQCLETALNALISKFELTDKQKKFAEKILKSQFNQLINPIILKLKKINNDEDREIVDKAISILGLGA